jgi:hypothetical protein
MRRPKHYCLYLGCPVLLRGSEAWLNYCVEHTCNEQGPTGTLCIARKGHQNKHIDKEGEEWE